MFTFKPNPVTPVGTTTSCSGPGAVGFLTWNYTLVIQNNGTGPFTIATWTTSLSSGLNVPVLQFDKVFGSPIAAGGLAQANLCVWANQNTRSGTLTHTFRGTDGSFTTPTLTLQP